MICLDNTDTLEAGASVASKIDFTVHGYVGGVFTNLAQGQLSDTNPSVIYTAGAAISIISVIFVNTDTVARTVDLYLDPANAGTPRRMIPKALSLGAGCSMLWDGAKFGVYDTSGRLFYSMASHAAGHVDGTDDIQSATSGQKGVATAAQITKLDGIATGADVTGSNAPKAHTASHTNGADDIQSATAAQKGVATAAQITKLDGIEALADVTPKDGWTIAETFTYASATTITVASGAALIYRKSDKLKLTQATGGVKYFYVTGVADTVLTITAGSSYTLVNEAITSPYYSHAQNPLGFPQWFVVPSPTFNVAHYDNGSGGQPTTNICRFKIEGNQYHIHYDGSGIKAGTVPYIGTTANSFIVPVNMTSGSMTGIANINTSPVTLGLVTFDASDLNIYTQVVVADNTSITCLSFTANYEI